MMLGTRNGGEELCSLILVPSGLIIIDETETFNERDLLFSIAKGTSTFKKLKKLLRSSEQETSLRLLYRLNVIISDTVDSLSLLLSKTKTGHNQKLEETRDRTSHPENKGKNRSRSNSACKGGKLPQESSQRLEELLPELAVNLLQSFCDNVINELGDLVQKYNKICQFYYTIVKMNSFAISFVNIQFRFACPQTEISPSL